MYTAYIPLMGILTSVIELLVEINIDYAIILHQKPFISFPDNNGDI